MKLENCRKSESWVSLVFCHPTKKNQLLWALEEGLRIVMSLVQSISHGEDFRTAIMYRFFLKPKDCKVLCPAVRMRNKWVKSVVSYGPCIIHKPCTAQRHIFRTRAPIHSASIETLIKHQDFKKIFFFQREPISKYQVS